jgi:ketosteroid isomerase-like protein
MSQEHVDAVRRNLEAWHVGDLDAWLGTAHPDVEWVSEIARRVENPDQVYRGHDGLRHYWDDWHSVWDVTIDVEEIRDLGDTAVALGRVRALGEASGVDLDGPIALVYEFEDGLIRWARAYLDQQQALDAVRHSRRVP